MESSSVVPIFERRGPLRVIASEENSLRARDFEEQSTPAAADARAWLERWTRVLELSLLFASIHDAIVQLGLATVADLIRERERVESLARTLSRLDAARVVRENTALLEAAAEAVGSQELREDAPATRDSELQVRTVKSLLLHCPMGELERCGGELGLADLSHRARLAYDGLTAFVARRSHPRPEALSTAGRLYAEGRVTIDEVAAMLTLEVPDAVAELEQHGFRRTVEGLLLTEEARQERLRVIRAERLARNGEPRPSRDQVNREVIATQRIEGIDARPWLRS